MRVGHGAPGGARGLRDPLTELARLRCSRAAQTSLRSLRKLECFGRVCDARPRSARAQKSGRFAKPAGRALRLPALHRPVFCAGPGSGSLISGSDFSLPVHTARHEHDRMGERGSRNKSIEARLCQAVVRKWLSLNYFRTNLLIFSTFEGRHVYIGELEPLAVRAAISEATMPICFDARRVAGPN